MKKVFLFGFLILSGALSFGQNPDIDVKHLHSDEGKQWKIMVRTDSYRFPASMEDDVFTFYTTGQFKYDQGNSITEEYTNVRTKTWSYNPKNNVATWEFYLPNGVVKKMEAEITYIDDKKAVLNLSENGKAPNIVVFIAN
jgi:hypothetical protein